MSDTRPTDISALASQIEKAVSSAFIGSQDAVKLAVLGLLGGLHVLIEDIPGVGKTTLAMALSKAAGMSFSRIQFTPDMLPSDVLGMNMWDPQLHAFVFREGPINVNFILADELNRTSPRTQAAFLEAMQDAQVSIDGVTRPLPQPFFLIATQNPNSFSGTFPLPEAELDRFGLSFSIGYPTQEDESEILRLRSVLSEGYAISAITSPEKILEARNAISNLHVAESVREYIVNIVRATRRHQDIRLGASPRAALYLQQAAKASAASQGRTFVMPEDVETLAPAVLAHRIQLSSQARLHQTDAFQCIKAVCLDIPKPTGL